MGSLNGAFLACSICEYKVCSWCQDPNPILNVRWVPVGRAWKFLGEDQATLVEDAIVAVLTAQEELQREPAEHQDQTPLSLEMDPMLGPQPGELETFARRYPVDVRAWTYLIQSPPDVIARVVRDFSLKQKTGRADYSVLMSTVIREYRVNSPTYLDAKRAAQFHTIA